MISKSILEHHYLKHHQKYVDTTNKLIRGTPFEKMELEEIVLEAYHQGAKSKKLFNQSAQVWNHTFYWSCMTPNSQGPSKAFSKVISDSFGSLDGFYQEFIRTGTELFGSGYVWVVRSINGTLHLRASENAFTPIVEAETPVLCADVWEHAYYLDVQQDRETYLKQFCLLINWKFAENNFEKIPRSKFYTSHLGESGRPTLHH